MVILAIINKR